MVNDIHPAASALLRQISEYGMRNVERGIEGKNNNNPNSAIRNPHSTSGVSVVEDVFNQIYSKSGFLEEQEVVPAKAEQLGTRLDVYA